MLYRKMLTPKQIVKACLLGASSGVIGVSLFFFVYYMSTLQQTAVTVSSSQEVKEQSFYASQHGAFSSFDQAANFQKQYPQLNQAVIMKIDHQYYVWSKMTTQKVVEQTVPTSFSKPFILQSSNCENNIELVPQLLIDENMLKNKIPTSMKTEQLPLHWQEKITHASAISKQTEVVRLHLLYEYYDENSCLKIKFEAKKE